ncbi:MAG: nucleoid-associated protein YgaU [Saprospiraceae bacterium]|jgi:nucleoid-associated protein YgaU
MHQSKLQDVLKLSALAFAIAVSGGCISAKVNPGDAAAEAAPAPAVAAAEPATEAAVESTDVASYTVASGDNLWCISKQDQIYGTAFNWPLIYKANASEIKDADLIYPGQVFDIPRDSGQAAIDAAVNHAKMRGAWAVGPTESSDTAYLGG